jgi:hypothetical protein
MQIPTVGTKNVLCFSVQVHIVAAGSLSQTVCRNDFLIPIGADFRNLNLSALYAYPNAGMANRQGDLDLRFLSPVHTLSWLWLDEVRLYIENCLRSCIDVKYFSCFSVRSPVLQFFQAFQNTLYMTRINKATS